LLFRVLEAIEGASLSLESINNVQSGDRLPSGVFRVSDRVSDDILKEMTKNPTDFFIDITTDSLDTTTTRKPSDGRLGDALDVLSHDLTVTLRTAFAETFTAFASTRHS
jgi:hypothetical protein